MSANEKMRKAGAQAWQRRTARAGDPAAADVTRTDMLEQAGVHVPFGAPDTTPEERAARREAAAYAMEQASASTKGPRRPRRGGHHGHGPMMAGAKAKDFKGTMRRMISFMGRFKAALVVVLLFAVGSTVFNIVGPQVISQATTELFNGIAAKLDGTGGAAYSCSRSTA